MIGYDSEEPRVYGISTDGLVYMTSKDGIEWENSVPDDVTKAKALPTYKMAKTVQIKL